MAVNNVVLVSFVLGIIDVTVAFIGAWVIYKANQRFMAGEFKNFSNWVSITAFLYLYHQVLSMFTFGPKYGLFTQDTIRAINSVFAIAIGVCFIKASFELNRFSKKYGFSPKNPTYTHLSRSLPEEARRQLARREE